MATRARWQVANQRQFWTDYLVLLSGVVRGDTATPTVPVVTAVADDTVEADVPMVEEEAVDG